MTPHPAILKGQAMQYFVVMIDYGRRGREAIVDPEITRRGVTDRIATGEYKNILFIHEICDGEVFDVTEEFRSVEPERFQAKEFA